jgi:hypothetical protein
VNGLGLVLAERGETWLCFLDDFVFHIYSNNIAVDQF